VLKDVEELRALSNTEPNVQRLCSFWNRRK